MLRNNEHVAYLKNWAPLEVSHKERLAVFHKERLAVFHKERLTVFHKERLAVFHKERLAVFHQERLAVLQKPYSQYLHEQRGNKSYRELIRTNELP